MFRDERAFFASPGLNIPKEEKQKDNLPAQTELKNAELLGTKYLNSLNISPIQRKNLLEYIGELKNPETSFSWLTRDSIDIPSEILKSEYIKNLAKIKFHEAVVSGNTCGIGNWVNTMDLFGIEEDFFEQSDFDAYRLKSWTTRINYGSAINRDKFKIRAWATDAEKEKIDKLQEKLSFGDFAKSFPEPEKPEIQAIALQGLLHNIFSNSPTEFRVSSESIVDEYKKVFKISDSVVEKATLERISREGIDKISENNYARERYPFIDNFLKSSEARKIAIEKATQDLIRGSYAEPLMNYFSISKDELPFEEIEVKKREFAREDLIQKIQNKSERELFFDISRALKTLNKDDWQLILKDHESNPRFIEALTDGLNLGYEFDENLELFRGIGVSDKTIKKAVREVIALKIGADPESDIDFLVSKVGLSDTDLKEAVSLGIVKSIGRNGNEYRIDDLQKKYELKELVNTAATQTEAKSVALLTVKNAEKNRLSYLKNKIQIDWTSEDSLARKEALKKMLISKRLDNFKNPSDLMYFIEDNYPERHKMFFMADPEIHESIKKDLISANFYRDNYLSREKMIGFAKLFNISPDEISEGIKERIEAGDFIDTPVIINKLQFNWPELDIDSANQVCVDKNGLELMDKYLTRKDWGKITFLKQYETVETNQKLTEIINQQIKNLTDRSVNPDTRFYAIEALAALEYDKDYLEKNYLESLIEIYTGASSSESDVNLLDLFERRKAEWQQVDKKISDAAYEKLIFRDNGSHYIDNRDPRVEILKSDTIMQIDEKYAVGAFETQNFTQVIRGVLEANKNKIEIPSYIFSNLYGRLAAEKESDNQEPIKAPENFGVALIGLLNNKSIVEKIGQLEQKKILFDIANNSNSTEAIKLIERIIENLPPNILSNHWGYFYQDLKNVNEIEFSSRIELLKELEVSYHDSKISDLSVPNRYERLLSYNPEQKKEFFDFLNIDVSRIEKFDKSNWAKALIAYIDVNEDLNYLKINNSDKERINTLLAGDYKDEALSGLYASWNSYLSDKNAAFISPDLLFIGRSVAKGGGAGNLKHVESLGGLINQADVLSRNTKTADTTKKEVLAMLRNQESIMQKGKWSQDEKSEFYNLSQEIINSSPSLYASFAPAIQEMSPKEAKIFLNEHFPLYQAQLITVQKIDDNDNVEYNPRDLVLIRQSIRELADKLKNKPEEKGEILSEEKNRLSEGIKTQFKDRLGVLKVPENLSKENLRSIKNFIRYFSNIASRSTDKEALISWFLSLELNKSWSKFRQGEEINPDEYLSEKQSTLIKPLLEESAKTNRLPIELIGISEDKGARFQELLQAEEMSSMIGNIQTVDIRLGNIKRNIDELSDPDIYQQLVDRELVNLLAKQGRAVGTVLAKTYESANGRDIYLSEEEKEIQSQLGRIMRISNWNTEEVKRAQEKIRPFSLVNQLANKIKEEKVEDNILDLQTRLIPSDKIIAIFKDLGEDFKQESGAIALAKDITYLENLVIKDEEKLSPEDRKEVNDYLSSIKEKVIDLEIVLDKVKEYFTKIQKSSHLSGNSLLNDRLKEIEKIINSDNSNTMIVSKMTKDFNLIIENMRQCLGCLRKEVNNDTNLAFGDYNKFFMINQDERERGSVSDQIVFFAPVSLDNGRTDMSFVMDRVYGSKSPDVLISNVLSVFKKYQAIKKEMPEAQISISVSEEAMKSAGLNKEMFSQRIKEKIKDIASLNYVDDLTANIPKSAYSDNYVEFGGNYARSVGERKFSGCVLK